MGNRKLKQAQMSSCLRGNRTFRLDDERFLLYIDSIRKVLEENYGCQCRHVGYYLIKYNRQCKSTQTDRFRLNITGICLLDGRTHRVISSEASVF